MITAAEFLEYLYVFKVQFGPNTITIPVPMAQGGTGAVLAPTNGSLFYSTAFAGALLPTANNGVLRTDGSGLPSISSTLPSGLTIPGYLLLAGGTMTGLLILSGPPSASDGAATKGYVDTTVGNYVPLAGGTMTGLLLLSGNPVVSAGAANKSYVDTTVAAYVPLAGGTMSGPLVLSGNPTISSQAANKAYVDTTVAAYVPLAGGTMSGALFLSGSPTGDTQAATKLYVDTVAAGLAPAGPVAAASTVNFPSTYFNGAGNDGIGATLTATSTGIVTLDGVNTVAGSDYLFKNQADPTQNGIYVCTTAGAIGVAGIFTRSIHYDSPADINNTGIIPTIGGSTQAGQGYYEINTIIAIGTTALVFIAFGSSGTVTSVATGTGLTGGPITSSGTLALAPVTTGNLLANISGSTAAPTPNTLTAIMDALFTSTQGSVLYRNSTVWTFIGPGTSGQVFTTGGAAANPSWTTPSPATASDYTTPFLFMGG